MLSSFVRPSLALLIVSLCSAGASASLLVRGTDTLSNKLIYDSDLNITWYDFSYLPTVNGSMWPDAMSWAATLSVNYGGSTLTSWRLPATVDGTYAYGYDGSSTGGYNITTSELGHLFYSELGNAGTLDTSGNTTPSPGLLNTLPFDHLRTHSYWSGVDYAENPVVAWAFDISDGRQSLAIKDDSFGSIYFPYSLAVADGDVAAIPEPMGAAVLVLGGFALTLRRQKRNPGR